MDEFTKFLIIGLCIIAVLLIIFGGIITTAPFTTQRYTYAPLTEKQNVSVEYFVGYEAKEVYKTYEFADVNISRFTENKTILVGNRKVYNGLLFGKNRIVINVKPLRNMRKFELRFIVNKTNNYGALQIFVNDKMIFKKNIGIGEYVIPINTSYTDYTIVIEPESSGIKFWSPSVYELKDIELYMEGYTHEERNYEFEIDYDTYKGLTKGELILNFEKFRGELATYINGQEIFKNNVSDFLLVIPIKKDVFKPGKNELVLKAGRKARFHGYADLRLYHIREGKHAFVKEFNITRRDYRDFRGRLHFKVTKVLRSGGISVKIYHNNELFFSAYDPLEEKDYYYGLTRGDVGEGKNVLRIEALEDAAFYITDVEIIKM